MIINKKPNKNSSIITSSSDILNRMHQIRKNREEYKRRNPQNKECSAKEFIRILEENKDRFLCDDNSLCAYRGLFLSDKHITVYCPIEDFSDKELDKVEEEIMGSIS